MVGESSIEIDKSANTLTVIIWLETEIYGLSDVEV